MQFGNEPVFSTFSSQSLEMPAGPASLASPPRNESRKTVVLDDPNDERGVSRPQSSFGVSSLSSLSLASKLVIPDEAMHGLAGEIVRAFDPYTEADKAAMLVQLLSIFGNCIGPECGIRIGNAFHAARVNVLVVGESGKSRKGTSLRCLRALIAEAEREYEQVCVCRGLSTGEGIISALQKLGTEKRMLVTEDEFASVLERMKKEGSSLSTMIRESFDGGTLATMTRKEPMRVDNAHLTIIGQITMRELHERMAMVELYNGFAN